MKKAILLLYIVILFLNFIACRSAKDITILQDMGNKQLLQGQPGQSPDYRIMPDDNLFIDIQSLNQEVNQIFSPSHVNSGTQQMYGEPSSQFLNGYLVDNDGIINLPLLGKIEVKKLTINELQKKVENKTREFVKDATVKVKLLSYKIVVMGEVKNPGVYYNYSKSINVFEAISMANGITDFASIKQVLVVRSSPEGNKSYRLDLRSGDVAASEAYFLLPNDMVYVEPDKNKNFNMNSTPWAMVLSVVTTALLIYQIFK
jgi:polysaccharide export outer membrane protein